MIYGNILEKIGNTPLVKIEPINLESINLYVKLEYYNPTGSVKDRAAKYIVEESLKLGKINKDTTLIESSSGNFGIALSSYCKKNKIKFHCVVDSHISPTNEMLIKALSTDMTKVNKLDENGGYLLNRIKKVKKLLKTIANSYWVNQYGNPLNAEAYRNTLGKEICDDLDKIDYVFLGVSSGGTITGVSQKIKEVFPKAKVVAVDITGSIIFGGKPEKRYIPGIGSSMVPSILEDAKIDEVITVDEVSTIKMCHELLKNHFIFVGGSSGSVFSAIKQYFSKRKIKNQPNVVAIFADHGDRYVSTIYNEKWSNNFIKKYSRIKSL
jgi:cysteine synthase A